MDKEKKYEYGIGILRFTNKWNLEFKLVSGVHLYIPVDAPRWADKYNTYSCLVVSHVSDDTVGKPSILTHIAI